MGYFTSSREEGSIQTTFTGRVQHAVKATFQMSSAASAASFANERKGDLHQGELYGAFLSTKQYINQYRVTTAATVTRCHL